MVPTNLDDYVFPPRGGSNPECAIEKQILAATWRQKRTRIGQGWALGILGPLVAGLGASVGGNRLPVGNSVILYLWTCFDGFSADRAITSLLALFRDILARTKRG
jgi:hypothetical protein